jgi:hypothetical protein
LESIKLVAAIELPPRHRVRSAQDDAVRFARSCYDHLAGHAGVAIADALVDMGHVELTDEGGEVTASGELFFCSIGADLSSARRSRRLFCQPCLDWSERRYHIRGAVGAAILRRVLELDWFRRIPGSRALALTPRGSIELPDILPIKFNDVPPSLLRHAERIKHRN